MNATKEYPQPPSNIIHLIQGYLDNGLLEIALQQIDKYGLQIDVIDGRIVDKENSTEYWLRRFITVDSHTTAMKDDVRKLSKVDDEVLIVGPTGSGKELIAHALIGNREGPFVPVNCAGLPDTLIESLLFGHAKGSFTGASDSKNGLCIAARAGVLFLDEIGELPITLQAKILRAIQEKKILPIGETKERDISCRFVFATHRDLKAMMLNGQFRTDLYARISTFEIYIKGLKDRPDDIIPIIESLPEGHSYISYLHSQGKLQWLKNQDFSLGVRKLQQLVRRHKILHQ